tara:strand:- start:3109 stop:7107 length:3999 start_codon:yes stop_codon:yes gene_type:complete
MKYGIKEEVYIILLKYFQGDIMDLTLEKVKDLKNMTFDGKPIKEINKIILKEFGTLIRLKTKNPKKYASIKWVYPDWDKEEKEKRLRDAFPEDYEEEKEEEEEEKGKPVVVHDNLISPQNGKHFTYKEQIEILIQFYKVHEPDKTEKEIVGIIDRRRNKGDPKGSRIPSKPWHELCSRIEGKYGYNPLWKDGNQPMVEEVSEDFFNGVIPQRKAFIDWINDVFYKEQLNTLQDYNKDKSEEDMIKVYQNFVRNYLSIETPFRGLLVYHGLGTGKTATSVVTAEGLSKTMPIYTFLPASLETEFIKEVRRWGDTLFNVDKNNWLFFPLQEIKGDLKLRKMLDNEYGIDEKKINKIFNLTKAKIKKNIGTGEEYKTKIKELDSIKGIYLQSSSLTDENRTIYTTSGSPILKEGESFSGECIKLKSEQVIFINEEIDFLIQLKYNFIHYNGFPKVHEVNFREELDTDIFDEEEGGTDNQRMVKHFVKKYQENAREHGVLSPFRETLIIIDEVHNFVNEIINGSAPANVFYDWIVNSEDIKLVFLSGTPIINKPAEVAILYNMLRGILNVYEFSVISDRDDYEVQEELREYFYQKNSSIEQLHVTKRRGKLIISFIKNKTNFESILDSKIIKTVKFNNHTLEGFFIEIMDGLENMFEKKMIIPSREQIEKTSVLDLKKGKPITFDEDIQLIFNRKQKLFDIYENDIILDLSKNENFLEYFLDDNFNIPERKQVILRRMLLGMTSYYPIDRGSIINMPEIVEPVILERYKEYKIVENINIIPCFMTSKQWVKYEEEYTREKLKRLQQLRKKDIYNEGSFDYNIRTRQNCNIVYEDDTFRIEQDERKKEQTYEMMEKNGHFSYDRTLSIFSPKFYNILKNMDRFISNGVPTGKILYYSDFRHDSGSEVFEKILLANGYEKYDPKEEPIEQLISRKSIKKRYTFITGKESKNDIKLNKEAFNHTANYRGEYIHIILISSSGAEGITLKCVRQVHIMEPFWNYIRVHQVLGRAVRLKSHIDLPEDERNVEQYLYLSMLPDGNSIEDIFNSLKSLEWNEVQDIPNVDNIKQFLVTNHKDIYKMITKMISMKKATNDRSVDQVLFDIMEKKYNISSKITDIIKESSVDCIQNTRDDIQLNDKCLRFSKKLSNEETHFPGMSSSQLNEIDQKQFKSNFTFFIEPDIYVILAKKELNDVFIYYRVQDIGDYVDVRYIRENGIRICDYEPFRQKMFVYERQSHPMNKKLGTQFSIFQSIYTIPDHIIQNKIERSIFPGLEEIINEDNLEAYIIKYNITERLFYSPRSSSIIKLYDYVNYKMNDYSIVGNEALLLRNKKLFRYRRT